MYKLLRITVGLEFACCDGSSVAHDVKLGGLNDVRSCSAEKWTIRGLVSRISAYCVRMR